MKRHKILIVQMKHARKRLANSKKGSLYGKTAHRLNLLEVGVVLIVLLVKLLQPPRSCAGEWRTRGGTAASATSVIEMGGGVAGEHQGTTKGTFDDVLCSCQCFGSKQSTL